MDRDGRTTSTVRTADSLLPVLVTRDSDGRRSVFELLVDGAHFGAPFGPAGVDRGEDGYDPDGYWRGAAWPHLTYLFWRVAQAAGASELTRVLAMQLREGAEKSGYAEYWNPESGKGLGARPQSWACLAAVPLLDAPLDRGVRREGITSPPGSGGGG